MPSSRGPSQPRDRTQVSHIAGRFFTMRALPGTLHRNHLIREVAFLALKWHKTHEVGASVKGIS